MKKLRTVCRVILTVFLTLILLVNLYFIGARLVLGQRNPKLFGFSHSIVMSGSMSPAFEAGDLLVYREQDSYAVRDIVIFTQGENLVTHRIVGEGQGQFVTQGDANNSPDTELLEPERIQGKMVFAIPKLGSFLLFLREPIGCIFLIFLGLFFWELPDIVKLFYRKKGKYEE